MAAKSLTIAQAQIAFGVAHMTLHNWRKGTATKEALPVEQDGNRVRIPLVKAKAWAKKNGVEFVVDPETLLAKDVEVAEKPAAKSRSRVKH